MDQILRITGLSRRLFNWLTSAHKEPFAVLVNILFQQKILQKVQRKQFSIIYFENNKSSCNNQVENLTFYHPYVQMRAVCSVILAVAFPIFVPSENSTIPKSVQRSGHRTTVGFEIGSTDRQSKRIIVRRSSCRLRLNHSNQGLCRSEHVPHLNCKLGSRNYSRHNCAMNQVTGNSSAPRFTVLRTTEPVRCSLTCYLISHFCL